MRTMHTLVASIATTLTLSAAHAFVDDDDTFDDPHSAREAIEDAVAAERRGLAEFIAAIRADAPFDRCSRFAGVAFAAIPAIELAQRAGETLFRFDDAIALASLEAPRAPVTLPYAMWMRDPLPQRAIEASQPLRLITTRGPLALANAAIALPSLAGPRARLQSSAPRTALRWQSQVRMARPSELGFGPPTSEVFVVGAQAAAGVGLPELLPMRVEQLQTQGIDPVLASAGMGLVGGLDLPFAHRLDIETNVQERRFRDSPQRDGGLRSVRFALGTPVVSGFSGQVGLRRADDSPRDAWLASRDDEAFVSGHWSPHAGARLSAGLGVRRVRFAEFDPLLAVTRDERQERITVGYSERVKTERFGPVELGVSYADIRTRSSFNWLDNDRWEARFTLRKTF